MDGQDNRNTSVDEQPPTDKGNTASAASPARHQRKYTLFSMAFALLLAMSAGFFGGWLGGMRQDNSTVEKQQVVLKTQGEVISRLANEVGPSVVSIETTTRGVTNSFFGQRTTEQTGAGTGIVISENGLVITNRHVVPAGTTSVAVVLSDGTRLDDVEVVGRTSQSDSLDVAFLKITDTKGKKLKAAKLGDSSSMQVGDPVVAIGNALGQFENTVTSGIISGYGRSVQAMSQNGGQSESLENLFQTDAAINQGNSGGPLINLDGEVIGINTAVATDSENIGFAIPINDVKGMVESVLATGKLERPFLGVVYISITADFAKEYDLASTKGAYIPTEAEVGQDPIINDGPAEKAGLQEKDIILKVAGRAIDQRNSLTSLLGQHKVGNEISLTILRDGKERTVQVTLASAPAEQ